jgi:hypothetical protein
MGKYRADELLGPQTRKIELDRLMDRRLGDNSGAEKVFVHSDLDRSESGSAFKDALRNALASAARKRG